MIFGENILMWKHAFQTKNSSEYLFFKWIYYTCSYVKWVWDMSQYNKLWFSIYNISNIGCFGQLVSPVWVQNFVVHNAFSAYKIVVLLSYAHMWYHAFTCVVKISIILLTVKWRHKCVCCMATPIYTHISMPYTCQRHCFTL